MKVLRELKCNPVVEIGKFYAYEYNRFLHVGEAVPNPLNSHIPWAMRNLNTGKIEYPYAQEVLITEEPCLRVRLTYETFDLCKEHFINTKTE